MANNEDLRAASTPFAYYKDGVVEVLSFDTLTDGEDLDMAEIKYVGENKTFWVFSINLEIPPE